MFVIWIAVWLRSSDISERISHARLTELVLWSTELRQAKGEGNSHYKGEDLRYDEIISIIPAVNLK